MKTFIIRAGDDSGEELAMLDMELLPRPNDRVEFDGRKYSVTEVTQRIVRNSAGVPLYTKGHRNGNAVVIAIIKVFPENLA